jgi:hypothetical protein
MAPIRTRRASRAHAELASLRVFLGAVLAVLGYAGLTGAATGPAHGSLSDFDLPAQFASLVVSGDDVVIAGSIDHMFTTGSFSGPNRGEKQDRFRPVVDVVEVTRSFDGIRARLAALRNPAGAVPNQVVPDRSASIQVASLEPGVTTEALDAIDEAALGGVPLPKAQSQQLAYARADVPLTVFDGTVRDKKGKKVSARNSTALPPPSISRPAGEAYRGQVAVGQVVLNRVQHKLYPSTICGVVYPEPAQAQRLPVLLRLRRHPRTGHGEEGLGTG